MTTKKKTSSKPQPKADPKPEVKPEQQEAIAPTPNPEQSALDAEVNPVFDPQPSPDKSEAITAQGLAHAGREFRAGRADLADVLAKHDAFLKQSDNDPADVQFANRHKRVLESLPR